MRATHRHQCPENADVTALPRAASRWGIGGLPVMGVEDTVVLGFPLFVGRHGVWGRFEPTYAITRTSADYCGTTTGTVE